MSKTIDMQVMRYINLFAKISRVQTTDCFVYNNTIFFAVPKDDVARALGKNAENVKRVSELLTRRIKVIVQPRRDLFESQGSLKEKKDSLKLFVSQIVAPVEFTNLDYNSEENIVVISGSREQKAMMIGRDKVRQKELEEILLRTFGIKGLKFA